jgi:hypothetical protein
VTRRQVATAATIALWCLAVTFGALVYLGGRVASCFGGVGPGQEVRLAACQAAYLAEHPQPPLLDLPVTWLVILVVGLVVLRRVARRANP